MKKLNRNQIKIIAILAMLIDHIAWMFVPTQSILGQVMHFIGRFTGPTMAYLLYEGFLHTRDRKAYAKRLGLFAIISWIPFCSFEYGKWCIKPSFGVIYTLLLGFLSMWYYEEHEDNWKIENYIPIISLIALSSFGDWPIFDVIWPFYLYAYRNDEKMKWKSFFVITLVVIITFAFGSSIWNIFQVGCIIPALVLKYLYSGEPGKKTKFNKWFFYIFYPLHLIVLVVLKLYIL